MEGKDQTMLQQKKGYIVKKKVVNNVMAMHTLVFHLDEIMKMKKGEDYNVDMIVKGGGHVSYIIEWYENSRGGVRYI